MHISLDKLYNVFNVDNHRKKQIILRNLFYIYSKYLNKKKLLYLLKYRSIVNKMAYRKCICPYNCPYSNILSENESIPLYKNSYHKSKKYNTSIPNNISFQRICTFSPKESKSNGKKKFYSNSNENQNRSAFCNYINLNKINYFYSGNNSGNENFSSYHLYNDNNNNNNNINYSCNNNKNNIKDKKNFFKIKLSNKHGSLPNFSKKNLIVNDKNISIVEYANNFTNNNKNFFNEKRRRHRHGSYKNLTLPFQLNKNNNNNSIKNNYSSYSSYSIFHSPYKNSQKDFITERIYNRVYKKTTNANKGNNSIIDKKISDQQIIDFLNQNSEEKNNIIKKMKNQKISKKIGERKYLNANTKNRIINLNNLNNYSYINNNYNYYCSNNNSNSNSNSLSTLNSFNNFNNNFQYKSTHYTCNNSYNNNNNNFRNEKIIIDKYQNKNIIKTIYTNKKPKKLLNTNFFPKMKREPFKINYTNYGNENYNNQNIIVESDYDNCPSSSRTSKNINFQNYNLYTTTQSNRANKIIVDNNANINNYSNRINNIAIGGRYNIPIPGTKISPSKNNTSSDNNTKNNTEKREKKRNMLNGNYDANKNPLLNFTLNEYKSFSKKNKNKVYKNRVNQNTINQKYNKNIIQKSLNLFFSNNNKISNKNKSNEKVAIITTKNIFNDNKAIVKNNNIKQKKKKNEKIPNGLNQSQIKSNSYNNNITNNKKIQSLKQLKVTKNVINEQFHEEKKEKKEIIEKKESESLRLSVQSMNDSKIMELANKVIGDEDNLNRDEINEILNSKKEK